MDQYELSKVKTKRHKKIVTLLKKTYGYDGFKPKQYEIINRIINKEDICAILPTGYGKSLTFQMPALYLNMPAVIISPLISLMDDQRIILDKLNITSCCYNSRVIDKKRMQTEIIQGKYQFVYITPEAIVKMPELLLKLEDLQGISLIAIDEAHCISSYGFDFRPSYRALNFLKQILPQIPILAVTATATKIVGKDICSVLRMNTNKPIITSFNRQNLFLDIRKKSKIEQDIIPIMKKHVDGSVIIYCLTKKDTEKIASMLKVYGIQCGVYHADININEKANTHSEFINGKIKCIVATIAFGMGINKSDVRAVVHYGAPRNIEGYYQEIGRAGRDGKESICYSFYGAKDFVIQRSFIVDSKQDDTYVQQQLQLLKIMEEYMSTDKCRRKILLNYFGEITTDKCDFCDNCCGTNKNNQIKIIKSEQNIENESKLLIDLIESLKKTFGVTMYINILRGSKNKSMTPEMKKNRFFGKGSHKSVIWWKELTDKLIEMGYLMQIPIRGKFGVQIIKVSKKGVTWANMTELNNILGDTGISTLGPIMMENSN